MEPYISLSIKPNIDEPYCVVQFLRCNCMSDRMVKIIEYPTYRYAICMGCGKVVPHSFVDFCALDISSGEEYDFEDIDNDCFDDDDYEDGDF